MQVDRAVLTPHPKKRSQRYPRLGFRDYLWVGAMAFLLLVLNAVVPEGAKTYVWLVGVLVVLLSLLNLPKRDERLYFHPVLGVRDLGIRRRKNGGIIWEQTRLGKRFGRTVRPIMPFSAHGFGNIGFIQNHTKDRIAIVFVAKGSPISSMSVAAQKTQHDQLADTIRKMAASVKEPVQVSSCVRARPEDLYELFGALTLRGEPEVVLPRAFAKPIYGPLTAYDTRMTFLHEVQDNLSDVFDTANDVDMVMVVSVQSTDAFKRALKKRKIDQVELNRQPIMRIMNAAMPTLRKQADDVEVLDMEGVERYLRKAWDVKGLQAYNARAHHRHESNEEIVPDEWFPTQYIRVGKDFVEIDGTFGATLKLTGFSSSAAEPYLAREFYWSTARWHSHSVIGETVHGGVEYNLSQGGFGIFSDLKDIMGVDQTGPRAERQARQVEERLGEIDTSVYSQAFNPYVAVSATSHDELEAEVDAEMQRLAAIGMAPMRIEGESSQLLAYLSATTGLDLI